MKRNTLGNIIAFLFKYVWLLCVLLLFLEIGSTTYTAAILMQQSAQGVMESVQGEISGRVDGVLRLLNGLASDPYYSDLSIPMFERATAADSYRLSYDLYMIAFCDEHINVISSDETEPSSEPFSLAYRDYMQELYTTGRYQITDAFLAGADNKTMNYTIAVPILKNDVVKGCVFGSIYFNDIEAIMDRSTAPGHHFYLLGNDSVLMAGKGDYHIGTNFDEESRNSQLIGTSINEINLNLASGKGGDFWQWDSKGLRYVQYAPVSPTNWSLVYQVRFRSIFGDLMPVLLAKCIFYLLLCTFITVFCKRYFKRHLGALDHLLDRMNSMQRELFQTKGTDTTNYENLLELTQKGLTDQLTGLVTRAVLFKKMDPSRLDQNQKGTLCFMDLDDLKRINDNYGHEAGDFALVHFAKVLKHYELEYGGIAARYGGDEFILVLPDLDETASAKLCEKLRADFNTTITIHDVSFPIHGSIGMAHYPRHGIALEELISKADLALYSAKQHGKNCCCSYDDI